MEFVELPNRALCLSVLLSSTRRHSPALHEGWVSRQVEARPLEIGFLDGAPSPVERKRCVQGMGSCGVGVGALGSLVVCSVPPQVNGWCWRPGCWDGPVHSLAWHLAVAPSWWVLG